MLHSFRVSSFFISTVALGLALIALPVYAATPTITSAKVTAPNAVTLVFSEPVTSQVSDYSYLSGFLAGRNIINLTGSGTNTVILTLDGSPMASDATGALTIASTTESMSDQLGFTSGQVGVTDGQLPYITSFNLSTNSTGGSFAKPADTITLTFNASENLSSAIVSVGTNTISVSGSGEGPYTASYTLTSSDINVTPPIAISLTDSAGNVSNKTSFSIGNGTVLPPTIASITSDANIASTLHVGNVINFTLTPAAAEPFATVQGSYDGVPLTWTTTNNGATFVATYTVQSTNTAQTYPLQITGVTLTDSAGNVSPPASGSDIQKTIYTALPILAQVTPIATPATTMPSYTFTSSEAGTLIYGGDCSSPVMSVAAGQTNITFNALANGFHSNCTLQLTDAYGNISNILAVSQFIVDPAALLPQPIVVPVVTTTVPVAPTPVAPAHPSHPTYKFNRNLSLGATGTDVRQLQQRLISMGFLKAAVSGRFAAQTQAALKKLQAKYHLQQTGTLGPATRAILNK